MLNRSPERITKPTMKTQKPLSPLQRIKRGYELLETFSSRMAVLVRAGKLSERAHRRRIKCWLDGLRENDLEAFRDVEREVFIRSAEQEALAHSKWN
jgi:hypothetical protein